MSDVERLFEQYREAHRTGGEADPRPYLERVEGADRAELAALIDGYLARAPGRQWDAAEFAGSPAERLTDRITAGWREDPALEPGGWRELLPKLRNQARVKRADLVARLAEALGAGAQSDKVAAYYHQMEIGKLPSEGVSDRVLEALAAIVGESAERIRAAGSVLDAGGDENEVRTKLAFARTAVQNPDFASEAAPADIVDESRSTDLEAPEEDAVDRLFTGGPGADG